MPDMNGIEVLTELEKSAFSGAVIMVSTYTEKGAPLTLKALELGAFDFILKPSLSSMEANLAILRERFLPMAEALAQRKKINRLLLGNVEQDEKGPLAHFQDVISRPSDISIKGNAITTTPQIIAIGVSTGGPKALAEIIPKFPRRLLVPIVIVQHMPQEFTAEFARNLNAKSRLTVKEAENGEALHAGTVYIAPGGRQLRVVQAVSEKIIQVTDDPPANGCKPSVDYCFRSIAKLYGSKAMGIVLTGMGRDGAVGAQVMKSYGARIMVQDETTSVVFGMPKAVIDAGAADLVCPLHKMSDEIDHALNG